MRPRTRRSGLLARDVADELVVYDRERDTAHCLNRTAALVFRHADGTRSVEDLAALLDPQAGAEALAAVRLSLEQLAAEALVERDSLPVAPARGMTRRDVARRVGIAAAVLLPAVATIVAPTPAEAAATCLTGAGACAGQPNGTSCSCFGPPCTSTCQGGVCQEGPC